MIEVRTAVPADADLLVLRAEDEAEARLYRGSARDNLELSIRVSLPSAWTATENGRVVAIGGLRKGPKVLTPWLMCSEAAKAHPRALLTAGRWIVSECRAAGLPVVNFVGRNSAGNKRFLQRLGFVIEPCPDNPAFDRFHLPLN